ncbi:MAG TPA: helix-turn-helix domain-containing protein [Steroidobacteraceae bacterium]
MPKPLSSLERRILDYIVDYLRRNTYQPSIREIARRFGIKSTKTVSEYLQSLADKGWIERDPSRSRGVRVIGLEMVADTVSVPHYDRLSGNGEAPVATLELDRQLVGGAGSFLVALGVDSDESEGLRAGDLLVVEPVTAKEMEPGDLAVLRTPRGAAVQRWQDSSEQSDSLQGRVLSVIRRVRQPDLAASSSAS